MCFVRHGETTSRVIRPHSAVTINHNAAAAASMSMNASNTSSTRSGEIRIAYKRRRTRAVTGHKVSDSSGSAQDMTVQLREVAAIRIPGAPLSLGKITIRHGKSRRKIACKWLCAWRLGGTVVALLESRDQRRTPPRRHGLSELPTVHTSRLRQHVCDRLVHMSAVQRHVVSAAARWPAVGGSARWPGTRDRAWRRAAIK